MPPVPAAPPYAVMLTEVTPAGTTHERRRYDSTLQGPDVSRNRPRYVSVVPSAGIIVPLTMVIPRFELISNVAMLRSAPPLM